MVACLTGTETYCHLVLLSEEEIVVINTPPIDLIRLLFEMESLPGRSQFKFHSQTEADADSCYQQHYISKTRP